MNVPLVIECHDGQYSPYSFVCQHLIDNPRQKWEGMEVEDGREVEYDWLCKECLNNFNRGDTLEDMLVPICIGCVRSLRGE